MRYISMRVLALTALAGLGAAACGSSGSSGPSGSTFSAAEAEGGAAVAQSLGEGALTTFTTGSYDASNLPDFVAAAPHAKDALAGALSAMGVHGRMLGTVGGAPVLYRVTGSCLPTLSGTITGDTATDTDADGVPDSVVATFNADNCTVVDSGSGETITYSGTIKVVDIGDLFGFRLVVNFIYTFATPGSTETVHEVGTETFTLAADLADLNVQLADTTNLTGAEASSVLIDQTMDFQFIPSGSSLVYGEPLPDGHMTIVGGIGTSIAGQPNSFSFDIATPTPLAYSAACGNVDNNPPFTAGHISGAFHGYATAGFDATFTGCGVDPTVTTFGTT
ncbi:MAG TPA: hypothetical protein VFI39_01225 [Gemmatimonadales bacterium]|nr:hypothetical protein [Gemmatimonadales bacterium]